MVKRGLAVIAAIILASLLASCSVIPRFLPPDSDTEDSREQMSRVVSAIDGLDAARLKGMFTDYARAHYSNELDDGIDRLLALFPHKDVVWIKKDSDLPSATARFDAGVSNLVSLTVEVSSGGERYSLFLSVFTKNTIDPNNVGIFELGAVARSGSFDSGPEMAVYSGCGSPDVGGPSSGGPPGVLVAGDVELTSKRMTQIVEALNAHDAPAIEAMFTEFALDNYSPQIDAGVTDLFKLFPKRHITWDKSDGGTTICERVEGERRTLLIPTYYTVKSGGLSFRFFFADFVENSIDSENVGLFALGAVPVAGSPVDVPEAALHQWSCSFDVDARRLPGTPSVYVPTIAGERSDIGCKG